MADENTGFDPKVAGQLSTLILTAAQQQQQLNAAMDRSMVANASSVLTLGVQQANMASLNQLTSISPFEAAATANLASSQLPQYVGGLNTAAQTP